MMHGLILLSILSSVNSFFFQFFLISILFIILLLFLLASSCFLQVVSSDYPMVMSKFVLGAREIEVDAVASNGQIVIAAVSEHVEDAGVHSGDATLVFPAQDLPAAVHQGVVTIARTVAHALKIHGPFNIQFLAKVRKE